MRNPAPYVMVSLSNHEFRIAEYYLAVLLCWNPNISCEYTVMVN